MKFLSRPGIQIRGVRKSVKTTDRYAGWRKLFDSSWKTFNTRFDGILKRLDHYKDLIESEKSTVAASEARKILEITQTQSVETEERGVKTRLAEVLEKLNPTDYERDQFITYEKCWRKDSTSWIFNSDSMRQLTDLGAPYEHYMWLNGSPGSGKSLISYDFE